MTRTNRESITFSQGAALRLQWGAEARERRRNRGLTVRILALQASGPGSTPGGCISPCLDSRMRPYSGESTPSRPIWEVKHRQAQLVLR